MPSVPVVQREGKLATKYQQVAEQLRRRIRRGDLPHNTRLPGEESLANEFNVSRGTIRQALSVLHRAGLIETWRGAGSYVAYDGEEINENTGWGESLASRGIATTTSILALERRDLPDLARDLELLNSAFLVVDRIRKTDTGIPISLEESRLPWRDSFAKVVEDGLTEHSLWATMHEHGLHPVWGEESIGVASLRPNEACHLQQPPGTPFMVTNRVTYDASDAPVETVRSLLHPDHFQIRHRFGTNP